MAKILDIPDEVLDLIFKCLVVITVDLYTQLYICSDRVAVSKSTAKKMRLVCRKWADWFCSSYLFDSLMFSGERAGLKSELIGHLSSPRSCGSAHSLASTIRCRCLKFFRFHPPPRFHHLRKRTRRDKATAWEVLESLVLLFQHSLIELDLEFVNYLSLPDSTIEALGRIKNLRTLRLSIFFDDGYSSTHLVINREPPDTRPDTECLRSLILAAQSLEILDLEDFNPMVLSGRLHSGLCNRQLPPLKHLHLALDPDWECSLEGYMSLAIAFQHTIKVLSVGGYCRDAGRGLKPVLETLQKSLEGLRVDNEDMLRQLSDVHFPNLRVFQIDILKDCLSTLLLSGHFFSNAPLEVIVVDARQAKYCCSEPAFPSNPFRKIPTLRRLIFLGTFRDDYRPPEPYILACKDSGVQWLTLGHGIDIADIMKL